MPELPEVEITARRLRAALPGRRIQSVIVPDPRILQTGDVAEWQRRLEGAAFLGVRRRAKFLLLEMEGSDREQRNHTLIAHLRMTGKLSVAREALPRSLRFAAELEGGSRGAFLCFHDPRRLGQLWLMPGTAPATLPLLARLGPDALEEPSSAERLAARGAGSRRAIKALLMDQGILGGLGNICAGEILFRVGLPPDRPAGELTGTEWERLAAAIPEYLRGAIAAQEGKPLHYLGERDALNPFALYRHAGSPCPRCGAPIRRVVIAGRGTYVCPECQKGS
jgi:formamidopyrimidine-DNA glycosylase